MSESGLPFDAVLLISFGGPQGRADIRPFLANVVRGRRVPPARIEEVVHHYELFDGVSPLTAITTRQADGLRERLATTGPTLPVYVGMRNWHPFLADTLGDMAKAGVTRALGFIMAAHHSYSSCGQYRQNVADARRALRERTGHDIENRLCQRLARPPRVRRPPTPGISRRPSASCPLPCADTLASSLPRTASPVRWPTNPDTRSSSGSRPIWSRDSLGTDDWALAFQSRSGRPQDPWLEPDICDYLRTEHARGLEAAVICPLGFVADHIEVLYDLDQEAADVGRELGLPLCRAAAVNDAPTFLDMMADLVRRTCDRVGRGRLLPIVSATPPAHLEGPPLAR